MSASMSKALQAPELGRDAAATVPGASNVPRWYVVRTRSRHEKTVRDQLVGRDVETFLPVVERWSRWKDRRKKVAFPLFPGYCFARFPLVERVRVLNVVGVADLLGTGGRPEPVSDLEIEAIQRLTQTTLQYDPHPFLAMGMDVEVVRGPLVGVRGKLLRKDRMTRLVLAVTLIRQAAVVEIHPADVVHVGGP
jgi:transcriptional antiterminator NusG